MCWSCVRQVAMVAYNNRVITALKSSEGIMGENSTRILIVDDHPFVREGLKQLLSGQAEFNLVGEASNAREAQEAVGRCQPEVLVVDLALGNDDGIELIRWFRSHHPDIRILVLSMQEEALYAERLLRLGVNG